MIRQLTLEEAEQVYEERMTEDFPEDELKPWNVIRQAIRRGGYACWGMFEGEALEAYAYFVIEEEEGKRLALLDYLAVRRDRRDSGVGFHFLQEFGRGSLDGFDLVILEAEDPAFASGEEEKALRIRRLHFYDRCGLCDSGVRYRTFGVPYVILEWPVHGLHSTETVADAYVQLYHSVMARSVHHIERYEKI